MSERVVLAVRTHEDDLFAGHIAADLTNSHVTVSGLDGARVVDAWVGVVGTVMITLELPMAPTFNRDDPITDDRRRAS